MSSPDSTHPYGAERSGFDLTGIDLPGLEVAVRFDPARPEARGAASAAVADEIPASAFYDIVHLGAGEAPAGWIVLVGEARSWGADASDVADAARQAVRSASARERSPARMLLALDGVGRDAEDGRPGTGRCSAAVAVVEPVDGRARITLAASGRAAPLVLRRHGGVEVLRPGPRRAGRSARASDHAVELGPGDALVLATDGITNGHTGAGRFDEAELTAVVSRCVGFTADVLAERVETASRAFADEWPRHDLSIGVVRMPEPVATATVVSADLPADVSAPGRARRIVAASLGSRGLEELLEPAVLLASEVVTNAVVHGGGQAHIGVEHDHRRVRVSVSDASDSWPRRLELGIDATSGRGVHLLDQLATRWGVDPHVPRGKTVWFELDAPAS